MSDTHEFFASCPRGLESVLAEELGALGANHPEIQHAGVSFRGDQACAMRVNLKSRIASRILWLVDQGHYRSEQDIYDRVIALSWERWMSPTQTLMVTTNAHRCPLKSLDFVTLRVKDAVCDRFRHRSGARPSVDTRSPDVRIHLYLGLDRFQLYLDTSGEPLFKRGLRVESGTAPLKKNLAAGLLQLAGWVPGMPLFDPFCGAGTFLLEAAEMSLHRAAGLGRPFGFEKLQDWDRSGWKAQLAEAKAAEEPARPLPIWGSDLKGDAITQAAANLEAAGLSGCVTLKQVNVLESSPPAPNGLLIANPPYGIRLGEQAELAELYPRLGDVLKQRFAGWTACLFTADLRLPQLIRLKPARRTPLYNGALECRLFRFVMVPGSNRNPAL